VPRLRPARPDEVIRVLKRIGFKFIRQEGSHAIYRHPDGRWTTVPVHQGKDIEKGLLRKILRDAGISVKEFEEER